MDADTGAPIEGAVVVAYWELKGGSFGDSLPCGAANVEEAVTDKEGRFHIPGWGPTRAGCASEMRIQDPILYIFKPGYGYGFFHNGSALSTVTTTHSSFDRQQLPLKRFKDMDLRKYGPGSYQLDFGILNGDLSNFIVHMPSECNWKKIPNMIQALGRQGEEFDKSGNPTNTIRDELMSDQEWFRKMGPNCGSPKEFIEGLEK